MVGYRDDWARCRDMNSSLWRGRGREKQVFVFVGCQWKLVVTTGRQPLQPTYTQGNKVYTYEFKIQYHTKIQYIRGKNGVVEL